MLGNTTHTHYGACDDTMRRGDVFNLKLKSIISEEMGWSSSKQGEWMGDMSTGNQILLLVRSARIL